jgi:PTS system mannose-specific IIA component
MIGILLISQGQLATAFYDLIRHVPGTEDRVRTICVEDADDLESKRHLVLESIDAVDKGKGVLIVTEVFCGTSTNLAVSIMTLRNVEVVAGMNLPMLLRILQLPTDTSLAEAAQIAKETGRKHINIASRFLETFSNDELSQPAA